MAVLAVAPPASVASVTVPSAARAQPGLEFKGVALGSTLSSWKTAPFPGSGSIQPLCSGVGRMGAPGVALSPGGRAQDLQVCTYVYADDHKLRADVPIGGGLSARQVRYVFRGGRLVSIRYRASPDAFDLVKARIDSQLGPPASVVRDQVQLGDGRTVQRVRIKWTRTAGVVTLLDPISTGRMSVVMAMPGYALGDARAG